MCSKRRLKCPPTAALQIRQSPRFIGVGTQHQVSIACLASQCSAAQCAVQWYRLNKYNGDRNRAVEVKAGARISVPPHHGGTRLVIKALRVEDKGVYFCRVNGTWGPGTELQVASKGTAQRASPLRCGRVATNPRSSSARVCRPSEGSVQDQREGRSHRLPGAAAGHVHRRPDATQAQTGEGRGHRLAAGQDIDCGLVSF